MRMLNNRMMIPALIIPLVVALIVGLFFIFRADEQKDPTPPDTTDTQQPNQSREDTDEIIPIEVIPNYQMKERHMSIMVSSPKSSVQWQVFLWQTKTEVS